MPGDAFLYIGTDERSLPLCVPYPTVGSAAFEAQTNVVTSETANGRIVGHLKGPARFSQSVGWTRIDAPQWWALCRWFDENGPFCTMRYFSHVYGQWRTARFLCTQFSAQVAHVDADGTPTAYDDAAFTLQSTGG